MKPYFDNDEKPITGRQWLYISLIALIVLWSITAAQ